MVSAFSTEQGVSRCAQTNLTGLTAVLSGYFGHIGFSLNSVWDLFRINVESFTKLELRLS